MRYYNLTLNNYLLNPSNYNILRSIAFKSLLKKKFIERDEFDTGYRLILNYGHSFGHAIEKITNFKIPHGLAVAHGMNMANFFSLNLNLMEKMNLKILKTLKKISKFK